MQETLHQVAVGVKRIGMLHCRHRLGVCLDDEEGIMGKIDSDIQAGVRRSRGDVLPRSLPPAGIDRIEAAAFIGVSPSKFDEMVSDGRMPKPKRIDGRVVWSVKALTSAFEALPDGDEINPWDQTCGLNSPAAK